MPGNEFQMPFDMGMGWRIAATIICTIGWIIFLLLFAFFWSQNFTFIQSIVIVIVSILVYCGIVGAVWATFGLKWKRQLRKMQSMKSEDWDKMVREMIPKVMESLPEIAKELREQPRNKKPKPAKKKAAKSKKR